MSKVWALELCYCRYETGHQVNTLYSSEDLASKALEKFKMSDEYDNYDGAKVSEWPVLSQLQEEKG